MADNSLCRAHDRYKRYLDKKVRFESIFAAENYVFIERVALTTTATERLAAKIYSKLCLRRLRLYFIINVWPETIVIMQERIETAVSKNQLTRAKHPIHDTKGSEN